MEEYHNEQRITDIERLSEAERALEFAARFGVDFQSESEVSISGAPAYFRAIANEAHATNNKMVWEYPHHGGGRLGYMTHEFPDSSTLDIQMIHTNRVPHEYEDYALVIPEVSIQIMAEKQGQLQRKLTYELARYSNWVTREDASLVVPDIEIAGQDASANRDILPDDDLVVGAAASENLLLWMGIDLSIDPEVEELRKTSSTFRKESNARRGRYADLNYLPIGMRELKGLRQLITDPHKLI